MMIEDNMDVDVNEPVDDDCPRPQFQTGSTLLPTHIASAISLVTRSSALYLRLGTFIGGLALDGARATTLTTLELSRAVAESILSRAGRDVAVRSTGELGKVEAESLLERSIATLHSTITGVSFAASAGFHISSSALSSAGDLSQHLLSTLDSILGSTDSSRAIASIITLIQREFENPATGRPGEKVSLTDLLVGICGLALIQRWCRKLTDIEHNEKDIEKVVWDVVILNDGRRADVVNASNHKDALARDHDLTSTKPGSLRPSRSFVSPRKGEILETIEHDSQSSDHDDLEWPEIDLRQRIMHALPPSANVSIKTEISTTKTITVDIFGSEAPRIQLPPSIDVLEEPVLQRLSSSDVQEKGLTGEERISLLVPRYRAVYRLVRERMRGTTFSNAIDDGKDPFQDGQERGVPLQITEDSAPGSPDVNLPALDKEIRPFSLSPPSSPELQHTSLPHVENAPEIDLVQEIQEDLPLIPNGAGNSANQKRVRAPITSTISTGSSNASQTASSEKPSNAKKSKSEGTSRQTGEKKGLRHTIRKGSTAALSSIWNKDTAEPDDIGARTVRSAVQARSRDTAAKQPVVRPPWATGPVHNPSLSKSLYASTSSTTHPPTPPRDSSLIPTQPGKSSLGISKESRLPQNTPQPPQRGNPNYFSSRDLGLGHVQDVRQASSYTSHHTRQGSRRNSIVSQTDTYSIHSNDSRPGSPTSFRTQLRAQSNIVRTKSEKAVGLNVTPPPPRFHRRVRSSVPSIYTLNGDHSATSLGITKTDTKGAYEKSQALQSLSHTGHVEGLFPDFHLVRNISRFVRFASASYGASFLQVMGIKSVNGSQQLTIDADHHYEHHSFSHHTQLPASTILLSSFVDPQGGSDSRGHTNTGVPMVHFVSLDHESRAVVLTCRGTLGFEDILTDMTCDYDDLLLNGSTYKVHKGMHASAHRLLSGRGSRVLATLAAALEEFPDYGLVLCGHSLGGAVVSLLAIMISEPSTSSTAFVTSNKHNAASTQLLLAGAGETSTAPAPALQLPAGRPIHVYAYGPPATISASLRLATRGLITTIVNGQDLVPYLSLGVLHDVQAIALAFKTDESGAKNEVRARVWAGLTSGFADKWYGNRAPGANSEEDDQWAYAALKTLRASMLSQKLVPPGEVFNIESMPVLQRDTFTDAPSVRTNGSIRGGLGRPATRAVLRYVRDVETHYGELKFGGSMLLDHSPGRYEASLAALGRGVLQ